MTPTDKYAPPDLNWLIERLASLATGGRDLPLVVDHAHRIFFAVNMLRAQRQDNLRRLNDRGRAPGAKVELDDLSAAARKALKADDNGPWMKAWAATSYATQVLVWDSKTRQMAPKGLSFSFFQGKQNAIAQMLAPRPDDALSLIAAAKKKLKAIPGGSRRLRKRDQLLDDLDAAIRTAVIQLCRGPEPVAIRAIAKEVYARFIPGGLPEDGTRVRRLVYGESS
jgi:hypothetical protein